MALARSASGPGGLNINTGTANSLFGSNNTSQPPASSSLFGASLSQTPGTGGLFGSSTTTSAPHSQGLFGTPQANSSSGSLFGATTNASSTLQTSGGLFGSLTSVSKPPQTGGLFGSLNAASQPQQTGGLFGNITSAQPKQGASMFGQNQDGNTGGLPGLATAPQQSTQSGGQGLFGSLNNQAQNKPSGPSFGSLGTSQTQQSQPTATYGPLFGSLNRPSQPANVINFGSTSGGLKMGQGQAQTVPGVRIDVSQMKGTTRFNDLHEDLQKQIENIDKIILAQQALCADCEAIMPSHANQLSCIPADVDFVSRKLIGVESSLEADAEAVAFNGQLVKSDAENAKLSFKAIDNLKLPPQYHQGNWIANSAVIPSSQSQDSGSSPDLVSFFSQTADEMTTTLQRYQTHISEIEQHLRSVEAATMGQAQQLKGNGHGDDIGQKQREVAVVLREFEGAIRRIAVQVANSREGVQGLLLGSFVNQNDGKVPGSTSRTGIY